MIFRRDKDKLETDMATIVLSVWGESNQTQCTLKSRLHHGRNTTTENVREGHGQRETEGEKRVRIKGLTSVSPYKKVKSVTEFLFQLSKVYDLQLGLVERNSTPSNRV